MDESTLVLVQVIFRHGIRAPDHLVSYPGDPYQNITYEPFGRGQLTKEGRKQCYDFGHELRERYNNFLGPEFHNTMIEAHSSEVGRARTTLQLVLAGLFPPTKATRVADDLNWQPVLYNYKPLQEDPLIGSMIMQVTGNINHSGFQKSANSIEVIKHIEEKLSWKIEHNSQIIMIYDIIKSQTDLGMKIPQWAIDIYPEKVQLEALSYLVENMARKDYLKNGCGALLQKILVDMEKKIQNSENDPKKIILYSGHDINVCALMQVLKFPKLIWPLYMGSLTFELHKVNGEFFVKIIFIDGYIKEEHKTERILNLQTLNVLENDEDGWKLPELRKHVESYLK